MQNNLLIHIADANRGLDCNCVCLECGGKLSAKKGDVNQHHFAHYNQVDGDGCLGGVESALHKYAKQVIEKAGYLELPAFKVNLPFPDNDFITEIAARRAVFERVTIEERMTFGRRRIDVVGYESEGRILIEIFVSHRVKGKKLNDVKIAEEAMIEIQIQREVMFPNGVLITEDLDKLILDSHTNKHWLYHPKVNELKDDLQKQALEAKLKQRQLESEAKKLAELALNQPAIQIHRFEQIDSPSDRRQGGVPSRVGCSEEEYVQAMYDFLSYEEFDKRAGFIESFKLGKNITNQDIKIAEKLGLIF